MGLWRRLDAIDRRLLARQDRQFDQPRPWWVRYAFVAMLPLLLVGGFARTNGHAWWVAYAVSALLMVTTIVFVVHWTRAHRRPSDYLDRR